MKKLFLKSLINFAMIETAMAATSLGVSSTIPTEEVVKAFLFVFVLFNAFGLVPVIATSFLFAALSKD